MSSNIKDLNNFRNLMSSYVSLSNNNAIQVKSRGEIILKEYYIYKLRDTRSLSALNYMIL